MMQSPKCKYLNQLTSTLYFSTARQKTAQRFFLEDRKLVYYSPYILRKNEMMRNDHHALFCLPLGKHSSKVFFGIQTVV